MEACQPSGRAEISDPWVKKKTPAIGLQFHVLSIAVLVSDRLQHFNYMCE